MSGAIHHPAIQPVFVAQDRILRPRRFFQIRRMNRHLFFNFQLWLEHTRKSFNTYTLIHLITFYYTLLHSITFYRLAPARALATPSAPRPAVGHPSLITARRLANGMSARRHLKRNVRESLLNRPDHAV